MGMKLTSAASLVGLLAALPFVVATSVDLTLSPRANGKDVVEAVVDLVRSKCILSDDRLFLRRLAYVASKDGEDSKTFRPAYYGGIWQLDEDKYLRTKLCPTTIRKKCDLINSKFSIDWRNTQWHDLQKPLYSGLGAALFILLQNKDIPGDVAGQGTFWGKYYNSGGKVSNFQTAVQKIPDVGCSGELDLAFILDGSGSVSRLDFGRMLKFTERVISGLTISDKASKVATIEFGSIVGQMIDFKDHSSKSTLLKSISKIRKSNSGTNTAAAINIIVNRTFTAAAGSRADAKHVTIILTDGASNSYTATVKAAKTAKDAGIIMFAIGVGHVNKKELKAVASHPNCTHVFLLNNFLEIESLLHEIQKSSCKAPKVLSGGSSDVTEITIPSNETKEDTFEVSPIKKNSTSDVDGNEKAFIADVYCGVLHIYASYNTPRPGPAFYDIGKKAIDGKPAVVYLKTSGEGRPLYVTVNGKKLPSCNKAYYNVTITDTPKKPEIVCRVGKTERKCTKDDFKDSEYKALLCDDGQNVVKNPCTPEVIAKENLYHPYPSDNTRFIHCDLAGNMYVTQCPTRTFFNPSTKSCNSLFLGVPHGKSSDSRVCSARNIAAGKFYFIYPEDMTKYIQCDVWGRSWVRSCPAGLIWRQDVYTCDHHPKAGPVTTDPCNAAGELHPYSADSTKFIHCLSSSTYRIKSCPSGLRFDASIKRCDWPSG